MCGGRTGVQAGGRRGPERLQPPARTSALLAARGSASARRPPARRGRGGAPRRERPGAGRAGKPKYTAPSREGAWPPPPANRRRAGEPRANGGRGGPRDRSLAAA